ncbi:MAG: helix-turn-helix transcriptional regulator [Acetobacter aceti]
MAGVLASGVKQSRIIEKIQRRKFKLSVGLLMRLLRENRDFSQIDIARATGLLPQTIHYMETEGRGCTLANLMAIAEAMDATDEMLERIVAVWRKLMSEDAA